VYDNLGLEAVWSRYRRVLISDAGGHMGNVAKPRRLWPLQLLRVLSFIDHQRTGTYWGIRSHVRDFGLDDPMADPSDADVRALAGVATRLARMPEERQERLINWG